MDFLFFTYEPIFDSYFSKNAWPKILTNFAHVGHIVHIDHTHDPPLLAN